MDDPIIGYIPFTDDCWRDAHQASDGRHGNRGHSG
jgi:hypothetical protein